jgi:hypothetical protein
LLITLVALIGVWTLSRAPSFESRAHEERSSPSLVKLHETESTSLQTVNDDVSATDQDGLRMLLATHNRLFWYYPDDKKEVLVHEGQVVTCPAEE